MDFQSRGRSPSHPRSNHISPQPSPNRYPDATTDLGLDPGVSNSTFSTGRFTKASSSPGLDFSYPDPTGQLQTLPQTSSAEDSALLNQNAFHNSQSLSYQGAPDPNYSFMADESQMLFGEDGNNMQEVYAQGDYNLNQSFDPNQQSNINPANLSRMSSPPSSTPPNLLSPENHPSPGQPTSPGSTSGPYFTPEHSRHASLDPSSAAYPIGSVSADWQSASFQRHRRAPSDHSDVSSNAPSPYLGHADPADMMENSHSPLMPPQLDGLGGLSIENFSINDQPHISPGHSPYMSPQLDSHQTLAVGPEMMLQHGMQSGTQAPGPEIYTTQADGSYSTLSQMHARHSSLASDMGQANLFPAPTIKIEPAPGSISRQGSFGTDMNDPSNSLSPPAGSRGRSKSDPHIRRSSQKTISRSVSPGRSHSPSLSSIHSPGSLSPGLGPSRESSPGASSGRIEKNRRQSTSSLPSRDIILALADPGRQNPTQSPARVQKHPATFQCTLCPKRFTRAYNLRSHLRTHTDERPFVCTVCGKAFARQHDRKRHEGLHSGEKKFVCRGDLGSGNHWGCGRKFARADALGRHFRSEAGRICIKPLLDEEAQERARQRLLEQQHAHAAHAAQFGGLQPVQQPLLIGGGMDTGGAGGAGGNFPLPAALLAQYPALSNIDWATLPQGEDPSDLSDVGGMGRNSFDGTGEFDFEGGEMGDGGQGYAGEGLQFAQGAQPNW